MDILADHDPAAFALVAAIHGGDLDALRALLAADPARANVRVGVEDRGWRTPLLMATDWPGYFPHAPESVALLLQGGADPNVSTGGGQPETPLHWAASTDDLEVAELLVDAGADLDVPGGSIGTPLENAVGYGCWHVARLLAARGARIDGLWVAGGLGDLHRIGELLATSPPPPAGDIGAGFWQACHGGQRRAAELLLAAGADPNARVEWASDSPLDVAGNVDTRREGLAKWLQSIGARPASE